MTTTPKQKTNGVVGEKGSNAGHQKLELVIWANLPCAADVLAIRSLTDGPHSITASLDASWVDASANIQPGKSVAVRVTEL